MLIDFTVENFRSIKEPATLSAIAHTGREAEHTESKADRRHILPDRVIAPTFPVAGRGFELLPVLGIFGANASGKSNVLKALHTLLFLMQAGNWEKQLLGLHLPVFRFDEKTQQTPTRFRIRQTFQDCIYTYSLAMLQERVVEEILEYIPAAPKRRTNKLLFSRIWNAKTDKYDWKNGDEFVGSHTRLEEVLQEHQLFFALVNSLMIGVMRPLHKGLRHYWPGIGFGWEGFDLDLTRSEIGRFQPDQPDQLNAVTEILRRFDTGIHRLELRRKMGDFDKDAFDLFAWHKTPVGETSLPFHEESAGTQHLFVLAYKMLNTFYFGNTMLIDELGSNIHPNITREIIRLFQSETTNPKRAQLIFTSHDNTLQQRNLLRRDQIWFTAKQGDGNTDLYPLTDFKPRNDLAIEKAYLDGRFGAVPILPDTEELLPELEPAR